MDPISNVDRLVLILRQRLEERTKTGSARANPNRRESPPSPSALDGVRALAAADDVDDRQLHRAFIQTLLVDQFGRDVLNEAKFQQIVERVTETMEADTGSSKLLSRIVGELRAAAR